MKLPNQQREKAAQLLAEDMKTDAVIAKECGVTERCLYKWKKAPRFAARVNELVAAYGERALKRGLARKESRIAVLSNMHERIRTALDERAADPAMQDVAGGKTGLIAKKIKGIGQGANFQTVEEYQFDLTPVRELREIQEQIAEELGQRIKKSEVRVEDLSLEELDTQINELLGKARGQDEKPDRKPTWTN